MEPKEPTSAEEEAVTLEVDDVYQDQGPVVSPEEEPVTDPEEVEPEDAQVGE